jgi:two-component system alkaline phosphatase synthesis response regulator PhoP
MANERILVVEDEEHILEPLKLNLELEGYKVVGVQDGLSAIKRFKEESFDLIILDIMLPEMDGITVCESIRLHNNEVPILFLSARNSGEDRVLGLKKGGDDYLTKPFNLEELMLRVSLLIHKSKRISGVESKTPNIFHFGNCWINFESYEAQGVNEAFTLTKKEVMLLRLLIDNKNEVVSREKILQSVWGYNVFPSTRTIDNFILMLRKHFETDPKNPQYIESVRGVGYKFVV